MIYMARQLFTRLFCVSIISATFATIALFGVTANAVLIQDFDDPSYALTRHGAEPGPAIVSGGPAGNFVRLTHDIGNQSNTIAFDVDPSATGPQPQGITFEFDFRMSDEAGHTGCCGQRADGFGIGLFATSTYGTTGAGPPNGAIVWERPAFPDAFTIGFDIFDSGGGPAVDGNTVTLNWAGSEVAANTLADFPLNSGVFHRVHKTVTPEGANARVSVSILPDVFGAGGDAIQVFDNVLVSGLDLNNLPEFRLIAGGRTGGAFHDGDLDNIMLQAVPEPSTVSLSLLGLVGLLACTCRQRKTDR